MFKQRRGLSVGCESQELQPGSRVLAPLLGQAAERNGVFERQGDIAVENRPVALRTQQADCSFEMVQLRQFVKNTGLGPVAFDATTWQPGGRSHFGGYFGMLRKVILPSLLAQVLQPLSHIIRRWSIGAKAFRQRCVAYGRVGDIIAGLRSSPLGNLAGSVAAPGFV